MERPNLMVYAKEIRKEGEPWKEAVGRAKKELAQKFPKKATKKVSSGSDVPENYKSNSEWFERNRKK